MKKILIAICLSCCLTGTAAADTIVRYERTANKPDTQINTEIERPTPFKPPVEEPPAEPATQEENPPAEQPTDTDSNVVTDNGNSDASHNDNDNGTPTDIGTPGDSNEPAPVPEKPEDPPQPEPALPPVSQLPALKYPDYAVSTVDKFLGKEKPAANPWTRQGSNKTYNYNDSIFLYGDEPNSEDYVIALRAQIHKENPAVKYNFLIIMLGHSQDKNASLDNSILPVLTFTNGENENQKQFYSAWIRNKQSLMLRIDPDLRDKILQSEKITISLNTNEGQKNIPLPDSVCQQWKNLLGTVTK